MNIDIAYRLATIRRERGLSQEALANRIGVSRQAVSKWERAESSPDTDNLIALARLYGMTLDELLTVTDEEPASEGAAGGGLAGEADTDDGPAGEADTDEEVVVGVSAEGPAARGPVGAAGPAEGLTSMGEPAEGPGDTGEPAEGLTDAGDPAREERGSAAPSGDPATAAPAEPREKGGDYVHIGLDGLHVRDADGAEVHIGRGGIHLYDPEDEDGQEVHVGRDGVTVDGTNYGWSFRGPGRDDLFTRGHAFHEDADREDVTGLSWLASFPWALILVVAYVLVGVFLGEWARGLFLLTLIPIPYVLVSAVNAARARSLRRRRDNLQALFVLVVIEAFLCLGLFCGLWHPGWVVLLAIPVVLSVWEVVSPKENPPKGPTPGLEPDESPASADESLERGTRS